MRRGMCSLVLLLLGVLLSCGQTARAPNNPAVTPAVGLAPTAAAPAPAQRVTLTFWSAPNPPQQAFWTAMAQAYMATHPAVTITVRAMPESPTSEAGIEVALAAGTAPTASENVFIGFATQLAQRGAIVPLDQLPQWSDLIATRTMTQTIAGWRFADGHTYVLPLYANAMLFGWRMDLLRQLGTDTPPRTYSQILALGKQLKQTFPQKVVWARNDLVQTTWWKRWFDFFTLYDAASNGQPLITGRTISADDRAAIGVLTFIHDLASQQLLRTTPITDSFERGTSVMDVVGPWTLTSWANQYPELRRGVSYELTPPPVPDSFPTDQPIKTFADSKGIVLYTHAAADQRTAMWSFLHWVLADPHRDYRWLVQTDLPPARDDLISNDVFKAYYDQYPDRVIYAAELPYAVPPLATPQFITIQTALGEAAIAPLLAGQKSPEQAWRDWKATITPLLRASQP
jgi:multiple sugar transport system substrate-binding protein